MENNSIVVIQSNEMVENSLVELIVDNYKDVYDIIKDTIVDEVNLQLLDNVARNYVKILRGKVRTHGAWFFLYYLSCVLGTDNSKLIDYLILSIFKYSDIKNIKVGVSNLFEQLVHCDCDEEHSDYDGRDDIKCEYEQLSLSQYIIISMLSSRFGYEEMNPDVCNMIAGNMRFHLFTLSCEDGDYMIYCTDEQMDRFEEEGYDEEDDATHWNVIKRCKIVIESDLMITDWNTDNIDCVKNKSGEFVLEYDKYFSTKIEITKVVNMLIERRLNKASLKLFYNHDNQFGTHIYRYNVLMKCGAMLVRSVHSDSYITLRRYDGALQQVDTAKCLLYSYRGRLNENNMYLQPTPCVSNHILLYNDVFDLVVRFVQHDNSVSQVCDSVLRRVKERKLGRLTLQSLSLIRCMRNVFINDSGFDIISWDGTFSYRIEKSLPRRVLKEFWFEYIGSMSDIEYLFKI